MLQIVMLIMCTCIICFYLFIPIVKSELLRISSKMFSNSIKDAVDSIQNIANHIKVKTSCIDFLGQAPVYIPVQTPVYKTNSTFSTVDIIISLFFIIFSIYLAISYQTVISYILTLIFGKPILLDVVTHSIIKYIIGVSYTFYY